VADLENLELDDGPNRLQAAAPHFDVVIVGAGLSGIGAACHLRKRCPGTTFTILEARDSIGGTWDLFRYPGVRSDSDMHTLGYSFRPWREANAIAEGGLIRDYIRETAAEHGIDRAIRFGRRVKSASWSSEAARWTVVAAGPEDGPPERFTCGFLLMCSGYYSYAAGHSPEFQGMSQYQGQIIHPQFWPEELDYAGKRVVVIGSGATAMTLVPAMARSTKHVVMLQRSPTYVVSRPAKDPMATRLRRWLPQSLASRLVRVKNILFGLFFYRFARKNPERTRALIMDGVRRALGPDYDVGTHFAPRYNPWDQRLCLVPDADLFKAIRDGRASVVTDEIESFTPAGLKLRSGRELEADIVVTATGLKLNLLGDVRFEIDGRAVEMSKSIWYKGAMLSGVPNFASLFGYTNASWTLKTDLVSAYVCRLLNYMKRHGYAIVTPHRDESVEEEPALDFTAGYIQRARDLLPRQGSKAPWKLKQSYPFDVANLKLSRLRDKSLVFSRRPAKDRAA